MRRPIRHVIIVLFGCFVLLFIQLNRIQVYEADSYINHPLNTSALNDNINRPRGRIVSRDGIVLAESLETPDGIFERQRTYPHGELYAHSVGYLPFALDAGGVEATYHDDLVGEHSSQRRAGVKDLLEDRDPIGQVVLSLDHDLQKMARDQLGERKGSVVALSPTSGEIFAMWSYPSFDPNALATNDTDAASTNWAVLNEDEQNPILARTYREIFFPGSTFKVVTGAAGLESGIVELDNPNFEVTSSYVAPKTTTPIPNYAGGTCGGNLLELMVVSCNTGFAELAAERLGPEKLINQAQQFGFNQTPPFDLPDGAASNFPTDYGAQIESPRDGRAGIFENTPRLALTSIGQNDVAATPLQMALVAAAVSNGGRVPEPHVMLKVEDVRSLETTREYDNERWLQATSEDTAADLTTAMIQVVERGTAKSLATDGLVIGAKTGTAQRGGKLGSHAWIIAFAGRPQESPDIAVAVIVEADPQNPNQSGGVTAGPIAEALFQQFFNNAS